MKLKVFIVLFALLSFYLFPENLEEIKRRVNTISSNVQIWDEWALLEKNIKFARKHKYASSYYERLSCEGDYVFDKIILVENHYTTLGWRNYSYMVYVKSKSTGGLVLAANFDAHSGEWVQSVSVDPTVNGYVMTKEDAIATFQQFDSNKRYTIVDVKAVYFPTKQLAAFFTFWWTVIVTDSRAFNKKEAFLIHPIATLNRGRDFLTNLAPVYLNNKSRIYRAKGKKCVDKIENFFTKYKYGPKSRYENNRLVGYEPITWEAVETK